MDKLYPESKVEIQGFTAKHYDTIMNIVSFGFYTKFIGNVRSEEGRVGKECRSRWSPYH